MPKINFNLRKFFKSITVKQPQQDKTSETINKTINSLHPARKDNSNKNEPKQPARTIHLGLLFSNLIILRQKLIKIQ